jgi:hypothetical protein
MYGGLILPILARRRTASLRAKRGSLCISAQATVFFEALANLFVEYLELQADRSPRFARDDGVAGFCDSPAHSCKARQLIFLRCFLEKILINRHKYW